MRRILLSVALLGTLAVPALAQSMDSRADAQSPPSPRSSHQDWESVNSFPVGAATPTGRITTGAVTTTPATQVVAGTVSGIAAPDGAQ